MRLERSIAMPNEIFSDMKEWVSKGKLKSIQHQEFVYSYYWLLAYLWRYAMYAEHKITQSDIKRILGYNPNEKRLNYIMKKDGLLDEEGYSRATNDFPVSWRKIGEKELILDMLSEFSEEDRSLLIRFESNRYLVKEPLKFTGAKGGDGIYWNSSNTHIISGEVLHSSMKKGAGCATFFLYGLLTYIRDKSGKSEFPCANSTLCQYTGWSERRVIGITNELVELNLIQKEQKSKQKGAVNYYKLAA